LCCSSGRNSLLLVASKNQKEIARDIKKIYAAATIEKAELELKSFEEKWQDKYAAVVKSWKNNLETLSTFFKYPPKIRKIYLYD